MLDGLSQEHHRWAVAGRAYSASLSNPSRPTSEAPHPISILADVIDFSGI